MSAHPVLCKGRAFEDTVDQAAESIRRLGHRGRVLLKTDKRAGYGGRSARGSRRARARERLGNSPDCS
eukprot:15459770-Alexandrium_andersonii.AAC.1